MLNRNEEVTNPLNEGCEKERVFQTSSASVQIDTSPETFKRNLVANWEAKNGRGDRI